MSGKMVWWLSLGGRGREGVGERGSGVGGAYVWGYGLGRSKKLGDLG